jgi:hypothetical protein
MAIPKSGFRREDLELITNKDLSMSAHALMGGIDLDVASSSLANEYVGAEHYFTPTDDGLNNQDWFGKVYLFPPSGTYFWDKKNDRWKMTRGSARSMVSSHAVWFRRLFKAWYDNEIEQGLFFSNCPDMFRYEQKLFDFPVCILRTAPTLIKNSSEGIAKHKTCTSFLVYLQPKDSCGEATQNFIDIYSEKGRVLC